MKTFSAIAAAAALILGALSAPVHAAEPEPAAARSNLEQLNDEGAALYAARDYRRAIERFIQAHAIEPDPNLLFNIARCYEALGEVDAAIEKYESFLKTPGADTRGQIRARESLAALREALATPASGASAHALAPAPAAALEPARSQLAAWLTLGGSALFAVVGATFYVLGANDHDALTTSRGFDDGDGVSEMTHQEADDLVSSGDTKKLIGGVSFGLAGALAATYVVLLVTGDDDEPPPERQPSLGLALTPTPGGAALLLQGNM